MRGIPRASRTSSGSRRDRRATNGMSRTSGMVSNPPHIGMRSAKRRGPVDVADLSGDVLAALVMLVDPVPGEVAARDRRNAGSMPGRNAEGRQVRDRHGRVVLAKKRDLRGDALVEGRHEFLGVRDRCAGVQVSGCRAARRPYRLRPATSTTPVRAVRSTSHGATDDRMMTFQAGPAIDQGIDDFYDPGGMAEAVTGNIEDDRSHYRSRRTFRRTCNQPRHPFVGRVKRAGSLARSIGAAGG